MKTDEIPNTTAFVICGESGNGKSTWIAQQCNARLTLRFVVHEGFSVTMVIERYMEAVATCELCDGYKTICIHFDLTQSDKKITMLENLFDSLFSIGLLNDCNGLSCALTPDVHLRVYVELPAILNNQGDAV